MIVVSLLNHVAAVVSVICLSVTVGCLFTTTGITKQQRTDLARLQSGIDYPHPLSEHNTVQSMFEPYNGMEIDMTHYDERPVITEGFSPDTSSDNLYSSGDDCGCDCGGGCD